MAQRVPKTRCSGTMTEKGYRSWVRSQLRRISMKWRPRGDAMKLNRRPYTGEDKRTKWEHQCVICTQWFKAKDIELDHIKPCGSLTCDADYATFIPRLLCEAEDFRKLCKPCHKQVTQGEMK